MPETHKTPVGRAATPPPPNVGSATLGEILRLQELDRFSGRHAILALTTPRGRRTLREHGFSVFPVVPGLSVETVTAFTPRALIIDENALRWGPWAGALTDVAPELRAELSDAITAAESASVLVYWVRGADGRELERDVLPYSRGRLIAPGSDLYEGTQEGARQTRLVQALKTLVPCHESTGDA